MAYLEGAFAQMDKRLGAVEARLGGLEAQVRDLRTEVHSEIRGLRAELRGQFQWLVSLLVVAIFAPTLLRLFGR